MRSYAKILASSYQAPRHLSSSLKAIAAQFRLAASCMAAFAKVQVMYAASILAVSFVARVFGSSPTPKGQPWISIAGKTGQLHNS